VVTHAGVMKPICWIGHRTVDCRRHPRPEAVWPVRVTAGAFGDGLPCRDLFLSPDHAVFVDRVLIPIKHLINGASIARFPVDAVTYYHLELDRHDVVLAEGLPAESYLDTGNRAIFANGGGAMQLHPAFEVPKTWRADAIAPLACDEARVRPVWERLMARAQAMGLALPEAAFTDDPAVQLRVGGQVIRPTAATPDRCVFVLPKHDSPIRLVSRSGYPTDRRPWAEDGRRLGVCASRILWHDHQGPHAMSLDDPRLDDGWWAIERNGHALHRWTNGDAVLPLPTNAVVIEVRFAGGMAYRLNLDEANERFEPTPQCRPVAWRALIDSRCNREP